MIVYLIKVFVIKILLKNVNIQKLISNDRMIQGLIRDLKRESQIQILKTLT